MGTVFPVFGDDGEEGELRGPDGFVAKGQGRAIDNEHFHFRDPVREAADRDRRFNELARQINPQLFDARLALARCQQTTAHYAHVVSDLQVACSQKAAAMSGTSPDAPVGVQHERRYELSALQSQLADAEAEHAAALEELEAAKAAVAALVQP